MVSLVKARSRFCDIGDLSQNTLKPKRQNMLPAVNGKKEWVEEGRPLCERADVDIVLPGNVRYAPVISFCDGVCWILRDALMYPASQASLSSL